MRVTRSADGVIGVDGPSAGRGAWLCRSGVDGEHAVESCLDAALSRRAFARAWRSEVGSSDVVAIRERVGRVAVCDEYPDAH